jgi:hypothetical protein
LKRLEHKVGTQGWNTRYSVADKPRILCLHPCQHSDSFDDKRTYWTHWNGVDVAHSMIHTCSPIPDIEGIHSYWYNPSAHELAN